MKEEIRNDEEGVVVVGVRFGNVMGGRLEDTTKFKICPLGDGWASKPKRVSVREGDGQGEKVAGRAFRSMAQSSRATRQPLSSVAATNTHNKPQSVVVYCPEMGSSSHRLMGTVSLGFIETPWRA